LHVNRFTSNSTENFDLVERLWHWREYVLPLTYAKGTNGKVVLVHASSSVAARTFLTSALGGGVEVNRRQASGVLHPGKDPGTH
jgi:hypothetical protein